MSGVAIPLSFTRRIKSGADRSRLARHIVVRRVGLFAIGLLVNGFSDYDLHTIRIPGILQRIAICYLCGALIYLWVLHEVMKHGEDVLLYNVWRPLDLPACSEMLPSAPTSTRIRSPTRATPAQRDKPVFFVTVCACVTPSSLRKWPERLTAKPMPVRPRPVRIHARKVSRPRSRLLDPALSYRSSRTCSRRKSARPIGVTRRKWLCPQTPEIGSANTGDT